jgi:hypothetical protein
MYALQEEGHHLAVKNIALFNAIGIAEDSGPLRQSEDEIEDREEPQIERLWRFPMTPPDRLRPRRAPALRYVEASAEPVKITYNAWAAYSCIAVIQPLRR